MSIFYWINFPLQYFNFTKITRISRKKNSRYLGGPKKKEIKRNGKLKIKIQNKQKQRPLDSLLVLLLNWFWIIRSNLEVWLGLFSLKIMNLFWKNWNTVASRLLKLLFKFTLIHNKTCFFSQYWNWILLFFVHNHSCFLVLP